jgi:heme/copper-type cytochrome/quinol oxidase subunit 2
MKRLMTNRRWPVAAATLVLLLPALILPIAAGANTPLERYIDMEARMFAFTPAELHVNRGDRVTIHLQSVDAVHGIYVDGYDIKSAEVEPGRSTELRFVADRAGKFKFRCSIACGNMHPFMIGELTVGPNWPFWRAIAALAVAAVGATVFFWPVRGRSGERAL